MEGILILFKVTRGKIPDTASLLVSKEYDGLVVVVVVARAVQDQKKGITAVEAAQISVSTGRLPSFSSL